MIVVVAVVVVLAVGFVVFLVVADEIVQGEAIVRGDEIDARIRAAAAVLIQIGAAREPIGDLADAAFVAFPKTAHFVAIFAVPFRPEHRKIADLITAFAHVPRLCDQFHLREHRVLVNDFEEGVQLVHALVVARQGGGEIESKTVHMHVVHPIAQTVHHELERARMKQIEGVPGAGEIHVMPGILRRQPVVGRIIDAAETERRPEMISFRGVIVNDVENHLDAGRVQIAHHAFELGDLFAHHAAAGVFASGAKKPIVL